MQDDAFNYNGYEVVRQEFFAHACEPSITFNKQTVFVNAACLKRLPDVGYVQFLINPIERKLAVYPCDGNEKDSFAWCTKGSKRYPKKIICHIFFAKVMDMMNWNPDYRYKLLGKLICCNDKYLFVFDLTMPNIFQRNLYNRKEQKAIHAPLFPEEWRNKFGLPFEEHHKRILVKVFSGHTVFSVEDKEEV